VFGGRQNCDTCKAACLIEHFNRRLTLFSRCINEQWLSGNALYLQSIGCGFNSHWDKAAKQLLASCSHLCASVTKHYNLVLAGLAESNGSLKPRDDLKVICGLTACTPGSAPGPTLGNEYGITLPFYTFLQTRFLLHYHSHYTLLKVILHRYIYIYCVSKIICCYCC